MGATASLPEGARAPARRDEAGTSLVMALVFLVAIGMSVGALVSLTGNNLLNTSNLKSQRSLEYAAQGAAEVAVQNVRYGYSAYTTTAVCTPGGGTVSLDGDSMSVYCSGTLSALSASTRTVSFYACASSTTQAACIASPVVQATVVFDDYSLASTYICSASGTTTCGTGETVQSWIVK